MERDTQGRSGKNSPQQNQLNPPLKFHSGTCFLHNMAFLSMKYMYKYETLPRSLLSPLEASWSLGVGWRAGWKVQLGAGCWVQLGKGGHWVQLGWPLGPTGQGWPLGGSSGGEIATSANPTPAAATQRQLIFLQDNFFATFLLSIELLYTKFRINMSG